MMSVQMNDRKFEKLVREAIAIEEAQARIVGRPLALAERRWIVRAGFAMLYGDEPGAELAARVLEVIEETEREVL